MIRTIAIDDEPLALQLMSGYINNVPFLELVGQFDSSYAALEFMQENQVDLIFLDVQMPDQTGVEFVKNLTTRPKIIFTTAYEQYAIDGYKLDAIDYLLKPFSFEELMHSAQKAEKMMMLEAKQDVEIETNQEFLFIKSEYKIRRINYDDILYIEGLKDYVKIFLKNDLKPILSLNSLKILDEKLPSKRFMRIHRSFIVNLDSIQTIERNRIVYGKVYVPVGDQYKDKFNEYLDKNFL